MNFFSKISGAVTSSVYSGLSAIGVGFKKGSGVLYDAASYISGAFYYVNPLKLRDFFQRINVITNDPSMSMLFEKMYSQRKPSNSQNSPISAERTDKTEEMKEFYGSAEFRQVMIEAISPIVTEAKDIDLVCDHLEKMSCETTMTMEIFPTLEEDPLVYTYPPSLADKEGIPTAPIIIPHDIAHRFDGFTYFFETEKIKPSCENVGETKKNISDFCGKLHEKLMERAAGNPARAESISNNIPIILEKVFRYASLDGMGAIVNGDDNRATKFPEDHPLSNKFLLVPRPDQSKTWINFDIDDQFNLRISFTTFNTLAIMSLETGELDETNLHSYTSATMKIDLMDPKKESNEINLIRTPYVAIPKGMNIA